MGDVYLRRGGGGGKQALAPTITLIDEGDQEITLTITNNDDESAVIAWEASISGDDTPDTNIVELAAGATSSNLTATGLTNDQAYLIHATATVVGKVRSEPVFITGTPVPQPAYTAATGGTTLEYDSGGKRYRSHTFTNSGIFTVTKVGNDLGGGSQVDYLIIAGGGGGGAALQPDTDGNGTGGGGGAGGYRTTLGTSGRNSSAEPKVTLSLQSYTVIIGSGGGGSPIGSNSASPGNPSSVFGIESIGGGFGSLAASFSNSPGSGGSGGGRGGRSNAVGGGGSGANGQGFDGGANAGAGFQYPSGGGGGAGSNPVAVSNQQSGAGGSGLSNTLRTGSAETRAGGGGGGGSPVYPIARGLGGSGGGGNGATAGTASSGSANTGGGGGGGGDRGSGGNGGSGIVVIRYEIEPA